MEIQIELKDNTTCAGCPMCAFNELLQYEYCIMGYWDEGAGTVKWHPEVGLDESEPGAEYVQLRPQACVDAHGR